MINAWIVIDKPLNMTSTQVLGKVRKLLNIKKIGHLGTLDPLATGVLPVALNEATKTIPFISNHTKEYEFSVIFGISSPTFDLEGVDLEKRDDSESVSESQINAILPAFRGKIMQTPPQFSAIKIDGVPAYKKARAGEVVEIKPREVEIYELEFGGFTHPITSLEKRCDCAPRQRGIKYGSEATFRVRCSQGTYVRTLAMDICEKLGVKGVVSAIRRTQSGVFNLKCAISLEKLEKVLYYAKESQNDVAVDEIFLSLNEVLADIPGLVENTQNISLIQRGQFVKSDCSYHLIRI
ncbi:MAG: tRNA pseudouridine(55) synthase TruB, partial [Rickettsiales bacterium]|nr:tRNA pseudouridine(55) synthase TruB [Rickettsiales bacterium]